MQNMQFAGMIEPHGYNFGGYNTRAQSEGMAARTMNTGMAIAAPAASLGLGLMGLDPLSMGMRAGGAAMSGGFGFGGGLLAGAAVGGGMMAGLAGVGYMGNQIMSGAQQTQQFNNSMRSGYNFFNPYGQHGRGFSNSDIREIGGGIRSMAGGMGGGQFGGIGSQFELGPSFNELGRLAANMGRMGLADGVRNAKDFTEKFREMMKTVKTIAEDMGTTLEEAQKTMASLKGSGIFKNQAGAVSAIRAASQAGGLATTEVTGMMNIGSQISRMFGGTGKQGAMGGIKAIEQVGMAQQIGALSEEDIYQATGLNGAEGRRAFAQQNMAQTGSFLKSSKGRWLLASLAGKNGELDNASVNDFLTGGMGVEDTRRAAHGNLAKVGRANFIRNEGRLRGAVMEQFGGMAPAMAMMGWAQGRGIDVNSMGDREMLFMQRQLGLGRDEADSLVKMAKAMPDLMRHRRETMQEDQLVREHGLREQNSGLEGIKRKLEAAKNSVNNEMQKVGQDILNVATDRIASWGNKLAGTYEERSIEGIREAHRVVMMGGREGRAAMTGLLGGGKFIRDLGGKEARGFGGPHENIGEARHRDKIQDLQFSARMGTAGGMDSEMRSLVEGSSLDLKKAYAEELSGLTGEDRMAGFKRRFGKDTELGRKFRGMSETDQAAFMQQMEGSIGLKAGRLSETFQVPGLPGLVGGGQYRTEAERQEAMGRQLLGLNKGLGTRAVEAGGGFMGGAVGSVLGGAGAAVGRLFGSKGAGVAGSFMEEISGRSVSARAAGAIFDSKEMRRLAFDTLSGAEGSQGRMYDAISAIKGSAAERGGMEKLTDEEKGRLAGLETIQQTADLMRVANSKGGVDKMSDADWSELIQKRKKSVESVGGDPSSVTRESIIKTAQGVQGLASSEHKEIMEHLAKQVGRTAIQESQALRAGGIAKLVKTKDGKATVETLQLTSETEAALRKQGGAGAVQAAKMALAAQDLSSRMGRATSAEEREKIYGELATQQGSLYDAMGAMDVKGLRALGQRFAGTEVGGQATELIMRGQAIEAGKRKGGAAGAIASQLGVQFGADELKGLKGMDGGGAAAAIAARMGVGDDKGFVKGLEEAITAASKKGGGIQGGALLQRALAGADDETKKKLEQAQRGQQSPEEKIVDKIGEGNKYLEALVKSNAAAQAKLSEIAGNTRSADGEASGGTK